MLTGLLYAMKGEIESLLPEGAEPEKTVAGVPFYRIRENVVACCGGVGKVNAAMAAELLCLRYGVDLILNAGVAGCFTDLPTGTLVVASEFVQHDVDTTAVGDPIGLVSTVNQVAFPTWQPEHCVELLRRAGIEAVTGRNLLIRANLQEAMLHDVANTLKANNVAALPARAEAVMAENKAMSRELEEMKAKIAASKVDSLFDNAEEADGVKIASAYFTGTTGDTLRGMCDSIRDKAVNPVVAVLVGKAEDKITMAVTVNKLAQEKGLKAGVLVKELSAIAGGKGGGKPDFAMAGLKDETKIDEALASVSAIVKKALG